MSHYGIIPIYAHFFMVPMRHTTEWYILRIYANYGMHGIINVCHTMYIWHGTNACHTICGMVTIHVTL